MAQSAVTIEFVALVADVTARTNGGIGSAATTGVTSTIAGSDGIDSSDSTQLSTTQRRSARDAEGRESISRRTGRSKVRPRVSGRVDHQILQTDLARGNNQFMRSF